MSWHFPYYAVINKYNDQNRVVTGALKCVLGLSQFPDQIHPLLEGSFFTQI